MKGTIFVLEYTIMEYGSTPYRDGTGKKWLLHCMCNVKNSALDVVIGFDEPYLSFSRIFISNKTVSSVREHR